MQSPPQTPPPYYGPPPPQQKPRSRFGMVLFLFIGLGLVCSGTVVGVVVWGLGLVESQVADQLRDHPVLVENVGEVYAFEMNRLTSVTEHEDDSDVWIYSVTGSKGSGTLTVKSTSSLESETEQIVWAFLDMEGQPERVVVVGTPPQDL